MKKSIYSISAVIVVSIIVIIGIFTFSKKDVTNSEISITYAQGKDTTGAITQIIEKFNKLHKGKIKVIYREMPSDTDAQHAVYTTTMSTKKSEYDLISADVIWTAEFAQAKYVLSLDEFMKRDGIKKADYLKGSIEAATFKNKIWGLPRYVDAGLLFYRKDIISTPPKTWDELIEMATKYKGEKNTQYGYVAQAKQYEGLVCNAMELISAYGGKVVDENGEIIINNKNTIQGLTKFKELLNNDFVPSNISSFRELESHTIFLEGNSIFIRNWPYLWTLAQDKDKSKIIGKVGVVPLPKGSLKSAATLGGWIIMINQYTKHPNESWEFLKFLCGEEGQMISGISGGGLPSLKALWNNADIEKANPFFKNENFKKGLLSAVPRPISPIYPKLSKIMQVEISKIITGTETPEEAVKNMEFEMKKQLELFKNSSVE